MTNWFDDYDEENHGHDEEFNDYDEEDHSYPHDMARVSDPSTSKDAASESVASAKYHRDKLTAVFEEAWPEILDVHEAGLRAGLRGLPGCCYWKRVSELDLKYHVVRRVGRERSSFTDKPCGLYMFIKRDEHGEEVLPHR